MFKKKKYYAEEQEEFLNAVRKFSKKFGYKITLFVENDGRERLVQFTPLPEKIWPKEEPIIISNK